MADNKTAQSPESSVDSATITENKRKFERAGRIFDEAHEAFRSYQFEAALSLYQEALSIYQQLEDEKSQRNVGMCLGDIGLVHYQMGNYELAREYHIQALEISQKLQDKKGEADDWGNLGLVAYKQANFPYAIECLERALKLYTELEAFDGVGRQLGNLGIVYFLMGQYEKALKYFLEAIPFVETKEKSDFYSHLGTIQMSLSDYSGAEEYFTQAVHLAREFGDLESEACGLGNLGLIYQHLGEYEKARVCHEDVLAIDRKILNKEAEGIDLGHLGLLYQELGDLKQSAECHRQAIKIARSIGNRWIEASQLSNLGLLYYEVGLAQDSESHIRQALFFAHDALKIADEIGHQELVIVGNFLLGAILEYFDKEDSNLAAYICYRRAIETLEKTRAELVWEQSRIGFVENKVNLYERAVCIAMKLGQPKEAYEFVERGKSRAFLELLNQSYPRITHRLEMKRLQDRFLRQTEFRSKADDGISSTVPSGDSSEDETDYIEALNEIWERPNFSPIKSLTFEEIQRCLNPF